MATKMRKVYCFLVPKLSTKHLNTDLTHRISFAEVETEVKVDAGVARKVEEARTDLDRLKSKIRHCLLFSSVTDTVLASR